MLTTLEAINYLRRLPEYEQLISDYYLDLNINDAADRFLNSAEFSEVLKVLQGSINGAAILDLGAGNGIAAYGFYKSGAATVYAVEPDLNREIGCKAIQELCRGLSVRIIGGIGEYIPLKECDCGCYLCSPSSASYQRLISHAEGVRQGLKKGWKINCYTRTCSLQ